MKKILAVFILVIAFCMSNSCKKEDDAPLNPYDTIDRSSHEPVFPEPDPNSLKGLYKNIFLPKCANPGCHDGTFEPDYRTIESTYSTLVYQPVIKTTVDEIHFFTTRVIPRNVANSFLIERLTTTEDDYMPSNGDRLTAEEIDHVKNWINAGCPDINGDTAVKPDLQPNIVYYAATDSAFNQIDTIRAGGIYINPFIVNQGASIKIAFIAVDTADGANATDPSAFTKHEIHFSTDKNDFTHATVINAPVYLAGFTVWVADVPVTATAGTTMYFRIAVNDGHHTSDSVFPRDESLDYYKTIYAYYVQ